MTSASRGPGPAKTWDVFCRVIDNHGDLGVCWRLARGLVATGAHVRLWVDDARALAWMAPPAVRPPGISVHPFLDAAGAMPSDVVVEAFGCDPPSEFVHAMAARAEALRPVWVNLEYLSAESYVERSHKLPSPQHTGAGSGLTKWFFYPGFSARTGGLMLHRTPLLSPGGMHEPAEDWPADIKLQPRPHARRISLFSYPNPGIDDLLAALSVNTAAPTDLLVAPGYPQQTVHAWLERFPHNGQASGPVHELGALRIVMLPYLAQQDYDALLRRCDLNLVRGEDSLVSALDAGRPLIWHIYRQDDDAHHQKLEAFLDRYLAGADAHIQADVRAAHRVWNGYARPGAPSLRLDSLLSEACRLHARAFRDSLRAGPDLVQELIAFAKTQRERLSGIKAS